MEQPLESYHPYLTPQKVSKHLQTYYLQHPAQKCKKAILAAFAL
jgi:hypothetical protein